MKAKTKNKLIYILSAVVSVVFAFCVGFTYCAKAYKTSASTNPLSVSAYLAPNSHVLVNDTLSNPIRFGSGGNTFEIALLYDYTYDFDVRMKYSLSWSDENKSTSNVKLNFADPDKFIFDKFNIYYAGPVSKGNGKLVIINSVMFSDEFDEEYFGQTLTISISNLDIVKSSKSSNSFSSGSGVAYTAWNEYKNNAIENSSAARVITYNSLYDYSNGIPHPVYEGAYLKYGFKSADEGYETLTWLGGNKYFSGTGLFVVAGSENVELQVEVSAIWKNESKEPMAKSDPTNPTLTPENNIKLNYSDEWTCDSYSSNNLFEICHYNYVINQGKTAYIDILKSVEITCAATNRFDYQGYTLMIDKIIVNGTVFDYTNSISPIQSKPISNVATDATSIKTLGVKIYNTSEYNNGLYESSISTAQYFTTTVILANQTNSVKKITSINYGLNYYYSNGVQYLFDSSGNRAQSFESSTAYFGAVENLTYGEEQPGLTGEISIQPYSAIEVCCYYSAPGEITIVDGKQYDLWTELSVDVSSINAESTSYLAIETTYSDGTLKIYAKNSTNKVVTGLSYGGSFQVFNMYSDVRSESKPTDWEASYWKYYSKSGEQYSQIVPINGEIPVFNENLEYYKKTSNSSPISEVISSASLSGQTIYPNERVQIAEIDDLSSYCNVTIDAYAYVTGVENPQGIKVINSGSSDAFVANYSTVSYVVRSESKIEDFEQIGEEYYFTGILRPNQFINVGNNQVEWVEIENGILSNDIPNEFKNKVSFGG